LDLVEKKKNLHDTGHRERVNNSRQQSDHDVNADRLERCFHFGVWGRGLSMNQVQNG
jgi:hypothetical protein